MQKTKQLSYLGRSALLLRAQSIWDMKSQVCSSTIDMGPDDLEMSQARKRAGSAACLQ